MISDLSKISVLVNEIQNEDLRNACRMVSSAVVRDVSLTYRGEVRLRKLREKDLNRFNPSILEKFKERAECAIMRISSLPRKDIIRISKGNAMKMHFKDSQFSTIICSPPYGDDRNGVGYFQFSKNMLYWLGFSTEQIKNDKEMFLGEIKKDKRLPHSITLEKVIDNIINHPIPSNPHAVDECIAFYHDYQIALKEMCRVCDGKIAIVIGDRRLSQTFIDNLAVTTELMENVGYSLSQYFHREINKKRIPVIVPGSGHRSTSGGGLINKEHTLIYSNHR